MRAATYRQGGEFEVCDVPEPEAGPGELVLAVRAASICGTDAKIIRNGHRKLADGQRIVLGHEFAGTVQAVGAGVQGFSAGTRVGVAPNAGCGRCAACLRGKSNYCTEFTAFGIDRDGAHAPLVKVPAVYLDQGNVIPLPDAISDQQASLLEPLSCAVAGIRASQIELGDCILIFGAGPMGLLLAMLARAYGAARLIVVDPLGERLENARALGATDTVSPEESNWEQRVRQFSDGRGVDVAITACPIADVQSQAVGLLAPFGRLCLFGGLPRGSGPVPLDTNAIHYKNLLVTGTTGGSVDDYRRAMELVLAGQVDLWQVVSDQFGMDELDRAYEVALQGARGKVVLGASVAPRSAG